MEDDHVDGDSKSNRNVSSIFTLFSDLSGDKNQNPKHCFGLIKSLRGSEFNVGSGSNLEYSVKRLVRGLGSTKLRSQCGFFAALTCVLKYEACPVTAVLEALEKEQKPAQGTTKSELKSLLVSCVLTCGAIIHSGQFAKLPTSVQENLLKKLAEAARKKVYLLPVVCQFFIDAINSVDNETFSKVVLPICERELFENPKEAVADELNVLLVCLSKNQKHVNKFLQKNTISSDLLVELVLKSLLSSSIKYTHPIYENLGQFFSLNLNFPVKVWTKFVSENAKVNTHKDTVLINVFFHIVKNLKEVGILPKLLVPKLLDIIIKVLSFKKPKGGGDECSTIAKNALNSMVQLLSEGTTSQETRFNSIKKLLFYPGNLKFEMKTGTKCISAIVSQLSCDFVKKLINLYKQILNGDLKKVIDEDGTEENWNCKEKQMALHVLTKTLNHPSLKSEIDWKSTQIKFIFDVGFLNKCQVSSEVQKCAKECFYKAIMVQMPSLKELITFLDGLASYANKNLTLVEGKPDPDVENLWKKMFSAVETLKKKQNNKVYSAVHVFLIYMGFHLFVDHELAKGGVEELLSCYQRLKGTEKKKETNDETAPHWTEVTVDLILSLLSRENRLWRHVVSCVFPQIVAQITPTALRQIVDALDPKSEIGVLGRADSDESESDGESESSSSEEQESDLEEPEDDAKPNDQLRLAVRNALGQSAAQTDDESADMDDMDEEEEKRLNQSLSEAFRQFRGKLRSKKKKQTKEEEALTHFRLRVLDLVDIYASNSPSMGGCLDLLLPLFDLLELSIKDQHQRPLQNRVDSIIKHISSVKSFSDANDVTQSVIKAVFRSIVSRNETSALVFVEMSPRISDSAAFLVRCSQQLPSEDDAIPLVEEYDSMLKAFFQFRDPKLPISTFQAVLRMSWKGNFQLVATLFDLLASPTVRIFKKIKIIELLKIFYKNDKLHGSSDPSLKQELEDMETDFVKKFVEILGEHEKSQSKSSEKMYLSFFSNVMTLVNVIRSSCKRHRPETGKKSPWRRLLEKMIEIPAVIGNKKTRAQLGNLAAVYKIDLPEKEKKKRKRLRSENREEAKEASEDEESTGTEKKKKKKRMSAEKRKMKKESRDLREKISSDGLELIKFSSFDLPDLPQPSDNEEEADEDGGYANEVGEAFRPLVHKNIVGISYGIATAYVLADTLDKTMKADAKERTKPKYQTSKVVAAAGDTLVWQMLASVAIPGFTINRICALTLFSLTKFTQLPGPTKKWTTTGVGLASIPFIVKPIDATVDYILDKCLRPFYPE